MYKYLSTALWLLSIIYVLFSGNLNVFLLIMLWAMGAILGLPGKKKNESGSFIALATVMNAASIVGYI